MIADRASGDEEGRAASVHSQHVVLGSESFGKVCAYVARPAHPSGIGVLALPDADGLGPCYEDLALRLAEHGINVMAIDYYAEDAACLLESELPGRGLSWEERFSRLRAADVADAAARAVAYLRSPEGGGARFVFALGFGFGGGHAWLQAAQSLGLSGAVGFYGRPNPTNRTGEMAPIERVCDFGCPILGFFGWHDPAVSPTWVVAFERALAAAAVPHQLVVYRRAGGGFLERHAAEYPEAAADAWRRLLGFFETCSRQTPPELAPYIVVGEPSLCESARSPVAPARTSIPPAFPPPESEGGWPVLSDRREIAARGLDPAALDELGEWMATLQHPEPFPPSPWGFLVIKDGLIVAERYDDPRTRYLRQGIASIGKSLSSLAFGRWLEASRQGAACEGLELDSPLYDPHWLPEGFPLSDPRKEAVIFLHVLTHTSGIRPEWDFRGGVGFDFVEYTVGKSVAYPDSALLCFDPGKGYGYSSVAFNRFSVVAPHLAGRYLHETCGEKSRGDFWRKGRVVGVFSGQGRAAAAREALGSSEPGGPGIGRP